MIIIRSTHLIDIQQPASRRFRTVIRTYEDRLPPLELMIGAALVN
jgi:hypothetical protein